MNFWVYFLTYDIFKILINYLNDKNIKIDFKYLSLRLIIAWLKIIKYKNKLLIKGGIFFKKNLFLIHCNNLIFSPLLHKIYLQVICVSTFHFHTTRVFFLKRKEIFNLYRGLYLFSVEIVFTNWSAFRSEPE